MTGGSTDHHTREQLLCAQQSVLFLWMLLHVSPGPVTLPRARKTDDQQHLEGQRGRFKCSTCLSSLYILYENYQNMLIWTILSAWLKGLDWNISTTWSFVQLSWSWGDESYWLWWLFCEHHYKADISEMLQKLLD